VVLCTVDPGVGMFSSSSKSALGSKSFLWTFPECPVRIHVSYQFIDRLRKEVLDVAPTDREVGGLLIGNESPDGDIEVSDHFQLPPSESTKNFVICSDALTQAIQSGRAANRRVVGFYRNHLDQRIHLRPADLECARSKFSDPMNVFLVIRPHDGRASAAFFFWQDGSVVGGLTFPFSSAELTTPSWTSLVGGSPLPNRLNILLARARDRALETSTGVRIALLTLVVLLVALAGAWRLYQPTAATSRPLTIAQSQSTSQALGLRVEKALMGVVIAWNPESPEIAAAQDADLLIWDGSNPPAFIRLTTAQLHAGRAFFTAVSDRVEVRMDVIGAAGKARTESLVAAGRPPDILSADAPPAPTSTLVPTKQPTPPQFANPGANSSPTPTVEKARIPARPFTPSPPAARPSPGLAEQPQPPELESPGANVTALTQTFQSFNDPRTALPPRPPDAPVVVREVPKQQPVPDTRTQPATPVAPAKPAASSFQAAVPVREVRPAVPARLTQLVQSDNVVQVLVHISISGTVTDAKLGTMQGPAAVFLSKLALNAARDWHFQPAIQNGQAVASDKILEFLFRPSGR
jgi:periplasmic protein TonB